MVPRLSALNPASRMAEASVVLPGGNATGMRYSGSVFFRPRPQSSNGALVAESSTGALGNQSNHRALGPQSSNGALGLHSRHRALGPLEQRGRARRVAVKATGKGKGISFGDQLLDYIEGGPKLRRWYGAPEQMPRDGSLPGEDSDEEYEQEEEEDASPADAVLVSDGDSETGQMVVLSLILKRRKIRVLVKDPLVASTSFGPYVEPIAGSVADEPAVKKALRGVQTVIFTGRVGLVPELSKARRVQHLIQLSEVGVSKTQLSPLALLGSASRDAFRRDEAAVIGSGIPHTIIRTGRIQDEPSGMGVLFGQGDSLQGTLAREDAAAVCLAAVEAGPVPGTGAGTVFEVVNAPTGAADDAQLVEEITKLQTAPVA